MPLATLCNVVEPGGWRVGDGLCAMHPLVVCAMHPLIVCAMHPSLFALRASFAGTQRNAFFMFWTNEQVCYICNCSMYLLYVSAICTRYM